MRWFYLQQRSTRISGSRRSLIQIVLVIVVVIVIVVQNKSDILYLLGHITFSLEKHLHFFGFSVDSLFCGLGSQQPYKRSVDPSIRLSARIPKGMEGGSSLVNVNPT